MEMLKVAAGINVRHVPYAKGLTRGDPRRASAGNVDMVFGNLTDVLPQVQGGNLRALAVGSNGAAAGAARRAGGGRDVPGFLNDAFYGFVAPPGTPDGVVKALNEAIVASLKEPDIAARHRRRWG